MTSPSSSNPVKPLRLQKYLADAGVASRRSAEELIIAGRVRVNGKTVRELGIKINPLNAQVEVDGNPIATKMTKTYLAFHKPRGVLSTISDPKGRPSLSDLPIVKERRLFHVGRLDKESEGLILLTDDGEWANRISHPSNGVMKTYRVQVSQRVTPETIRKIKAGISLDDGLVRPKSVRAMAGGIELELHEGRNQIVRRLCQALDLTVLRLIRTQVGVIKLGELPVGKTRNLSSVEVLNS